MLRDDGNIADVVALADCSIMYINRAVYTRHLYPLRVVSALRQATLCTLLASAEMASYAQEVAAEVAAEEQEEAAMAAAAAGSPKACGRGEGEKLLGEAERPRRKLREATLLKEASVVSLFSSEISNCTDVDFGDDGERLTLLENAALTTEEPLQFTSLVFPSAITAIDSMLGCEGDVGLPLLRQFPRLSRRRLCGHIRFWRAARGEVIFQEGEPSDSLVIPIRGEVGLFQGRVPATSSGNSEPHEENLDLELPPDVLRYVPSLLGKRLFRHGLPDIGQGAFINKVLHGEGYSPDPTNSDDENGEEEGGKWSDAAALPGSAMRKLAECLLDVFVRRWKAVPAPLLGTSPASDKERCFVHSMDLEGMLCRRRRLIASRPSRRGRSWWT
jgi:hypothetical protein